jgi:hypothetical protein
MESPERSRSLMSRNSREVGGAEDKGKTVLRVKPEDPNYRTGTGEYERVKE